MSEIIIEINMSSISPMNETYPKYHNEIFGKKVLQNIVKGTPLSIDLIRK